MRCLALSALTLLAGCARRGAGVPVDVLAHRFGLGGPLAGLSLTALERPLSAVTDASGAATVDAAVGERLTLIGTAPGYHRTQAGTVVVPAGGLQGDPQRVVLQVPPEWMYGALRATVPMPWDRPLNDSDCILVTTVCHAGHPKVSDDAQGEPGAAATLSRGGRALPYRPYYFGTFGRLSNDTNPFARGLTATTLDGGVLWANVPPSTTPYTASATKPGVRFTSAELTCAAAGAFVNAAPNQGPAASPAPGE